MSEDRRVTHRSNKDCRDIAKRAKVYYSADKIRPVNIRRILKSGKIPTVRGEKVLVYKVVDDHLLPYSDATTELINDEVVITVRRSVDQRANWGDGRARMTLAHELAHGVMHAVAGAIDNRMIGAEGTTELSKTQASESAEHQAKVFAAAFLIDDEAASELGSPAEISAEFVVSLEAAEICFERLQAKIERAASVERVLNINREIQASTARQTKSAYLEFRCRSCEEKTLIPMGVKVLCDTCGRLDDRPKIANT